MAPGELALACFGGTCRVEVEGAGVRGTAAGAAEWARGQLLAWHEQFTRFSPTSELCRVNADPRLVVPASPLMLELAAAIAEAGRITDGVVDGTLVGALQAAGYDRDLGRSRQPGSARAAGDTASSGRKRMTATTNATCGGDELARSAIPAAGSHQRAWASIAVDRAAGTITRPPGVQLDCGGLVKGLLADVLAGWLGTHEDVAIDCCGDVALGGRDPAPRSVEVEHPLDGSVACVLEVEAGGVATSGTTARAWAGPDGAPAHHLLDPSTGLPANTGLIQVTALAPSALEAEVLAKWALLGGPEHAADRLPHGGVLVGQDGGVVVLAPRRAAAH